MPIMRSAKGAGVLYPAPRHAALPGGAGGVDQYPSLASDSASRFIPQIWSSKLIQKFYDATVFGAIAQTDYQGEISSMGDKVIIRMTPSIRISTYEIGMDLEYETPTSSTVELDIDKGVSFAFALEHVERFQADIDLMNDWGESASEEMKVEIDRQLLSTTFAGAHDANKGDAAGLHSQDIDLGVADAPVALTKDNILDYIVDMGTALDEQNVPETDRWILLPPALCALVKKSELRDASIAGDSTSILRNGRLGVIDRFTLYSSNLLSNVRDTIGGTIAVPAATPGVKAYNLMAGHKSAITFAAQMEKDKTVHMLNPNKHGELCRGLAIWGSKVVKPESLIHLYAYKG